MATYGITVNAAVAADATRTTTGSTTLYTAPANGYAIINVFAEVSNAGVTQSSLAVQIGGKTMMNVLAVGGGGVAIVPQITSPSAGTLNQPSGGVGPYYVGPSQTVVLAFTAGSGATPSGELTITGVEFVSG